MAQSVQNVTLSLTLPISCQICLGKVRKPVICCNHHVFCSSCIEVWLQKCSQCPTCRVSITPENPAFVPLCLEEALHPHLSEQGRPATA